MKPYAQGLQIRLQEELSSLQEQGLYKKERVMVSPQAAEITLSDGRTAINCCANNYLGPRAIPVFWRLRIKLLILMALG